MFQAYSILKISNYLNLQKCFYAACKPINYYHVLGLRSNASKKEIRDAFLTLSKQMHPDMNKNKKDSHIDFVKITEAYNVLSKDISRQEYDAKLTNKNNYYASGYYSRPVYRESRHDRWQGEFRRSRGPTYGYESHDFYRDSVNQTQHAGLKKRIVFMCLLVTFFGFLLPTLTIIHSSTLKRIQVLRDSKIYAAEMQRIRAKKKLQTKTE